MAPSSGVRAVSATTMLQAEQQYATSTTNVSLNLVQLFKALGGGWEQTFPDAQAEGSVEDHL
jgi:outer membrane protein TolC